MGRQDNSNAAVIAVILIGGLLVLFLAAGVVVVGGLFFVGSRMPVQQQITIEPSASTMSGPVAAHYKSIIIDTDADGAILIDENTYNDDEFRALLEEEDASGDVEIVLNVDLAEERRAEIEAIYLETVRNPIITGEWMEDAPREPPSP